MENQNFKAYDNHVCSNVDYTYESMSNGARSNIDHVLVSTNMYEFITDINVIHDIDNISDHSVLSVSFNIDVEYAHAVVECDATLLWASATDIDIERYKVRLDKTLSNIVLEPDILYCNDHSCTIGPLKGFYIAHIRGHLSAHST